MKPVVKFRGMKTGGMLARTGGSSAKMKAKGKAMKKGGTVKGRGKHLNVQMVLLKEAVLKVVLFR